MEKVKEKYNKYRIIVVYREVRWGQSKKINKRA